jgi:predicted exporter
MAAESHRLIQLRGPTMEQLLTRCEALRPLLGETAAEGPLALPCDYLPSPARQAQSQARIPPRKEILSRLEQALEGLPFRAHLFNAFVDDLQASRSLPPLGYEALQAGALRERLAPLLRPAAAGWLALAPLPPATEPATALPAGAPAGVSLLDLRAETSSLIGGFRREILAQVGLGMLLMLAVLGIGLRSLGHAIGVLLPIAAAILSTLGLLLLIGQAMNLFHLISLMLVVGIGIDFSLFFSRGGDAERARKDTLHALSLCALSTVTVFAILGSSSIPVLHVIGQTVALGVSLSYLATYAFWHMPWNPSRARG